MKLIPKWLQRPFERGLDPIAHGLIGRVHPNTLSTFGFLVLVGCGVAFGAGALRLGAGLLLASGVLDVLDGKVARGGGQVTAFGAFYDSTLDRLGEAALFSGIAVYFLGGGVPPRWEVFAVVACIIALAAGMTVSYARARAEGLGLECKVGLAQRAERIVGLGVPVLFFEAGRDGMLLLGIVAVLALLGVVTVVQRIYHVYRTTAPAAADRRGEPVPALADSMKKGTGGD